jgi:hypothetical protein
LNTSRKGAEAERLVTKDLEAKGFLVGSRRHTKGSGDHLAVHAEGGGVWLVETKAAARSRGPFTAFSKPEREAMKATQVPENTTRMLALVRGSTQKNMEVEYISESAWP